MSSENMDDMSVGDNDKKVLLQEFDKIARKITPESMLNGLGYWFSLNLTVLLQTLGYNGRKLRKIKDKPHVLNIGCGPEPDTRYMNADIIPNIKHWPRVLFGKRKIYNEFLLNLPVNDRHLSNKFDSIIFSHVLEHLPPTQAITSLGNCLDYLKPGSCIRVTVPYLGAYDQEVIPPDHRVNNRMLAKNALVYGYGHRFMYNIEILIALLEEAGFVDVKQAFFGEGLLHETDRVDRKAESIYVTGLKPGIGAPL